MRGKESINVSLSSGERNGSSLNLKYVKDTAVVFKGLWDRVMKNCKIFNIVY